MARSVTRINLQVKNAEAFLKLCENVVETNNQLGASSPFAGNTLIEMNEYAQRVARARQKREEALAHHAIAEVAMAESRALMGTHAGQTINTPKTLYYDTARIKKILQALNTENPEALSPWGFNVVVGKARKPSKKKPVS